MVRQIQVLYFMIFLAYNFNQDTMHFLKSLGDIFNINFIPNIGSMKSSGEFSFMGADVTNQKPENL